MAEAEQRGDDWTPGEDDEALNAVLLCPYKERLPFILNDVAHALNRSRPEEQLDGEMVRCRLWKIFTAYRSTTYKKTPYRVPRHPRDRALTWGEKWAIETAHETEGEECAPFDAQRLAEILMCSIETVKQYVKSMNPRAQMAGGFRLNLKGKPGTI